MLRPIKHIHLSRNRLSRNQVGVLWHIPRTVHLALVVDALRDLYTRGVGNGVSTQFSAFIVIVRTIERICTWTLAFGDLDGGNLEVVLRLAGSVCAKEQAVYSI